MKDTDCFPALVWLFICLAAKLLGLEVDHELTFIPHVEKLCKKLSHRIAGSIHILIPLHLIHCVMAPDYDLLTLTQTVQVYEHALYNIPLCLVENK